MFNFELGTDLPLGRIVLFCVGWAGNTGHLFDAEPLVGIVRVDFASGLTRNGLFRIHFATSGLF